jgi:hypothetical protein
LVFARRGHKHRKTNLKNRKTNLKNIKEKGEKKKNCKKRHDEIEYFKPRWTIHRFLI